MGKTKKQSLIIDTLIKKYGLKPCTQREFSLLSLSCIARGYALMKKHFGFRYEAIGAIGFYGKWHSLVNEAEITGRMEKLVKKSLPDIEAAILKPTKQLLKKFILQFEKLKSHTATNPKKTFSSLVKLYPDNWICLGLYNSLWRYVGEGEKHDLTPKQIKAIGLDRDTAARVYREVEKYLKEITGKIGGKYGFDGDLLKYFSFNELDSRKDIIPTIPEQAELEKRRSKYFYLYETHTNREIIITDPVIINHIERKYFDAPKAAEIDSIKGVTAFAGTVAGHVVNLQEKKIKHPGEIPAKAILVTAMTHPDDIALIKKCSAIVTDEGGILCHAAIISREMKKPCIIGTKNATKILKNGDLVEVDATNGIIKIIRDKKHKGV